MARATYNEPYKTRAITSSFEKTKEKLSLGYEMPVKNHPFVIRATADNKPYLPEKNSAEFFFKEHSLGVGQTRKGNLLLYNVYHPEVESVSHKNPFH